MGLDTGPVGIYLGSLYADKRLGFLLDAALGIRKSIPDFSLVIIGEGPEHERVKAFCDRHDWAHQVGARRGREKALYMAAGQIMLNPGLVGLGLGILDSFACRVPILTTDCHIHSPEVAYLQNGYNGVMTSNTMDDYINTAIKTLENPDVLSALKIGCEASAELYTLDKMVSRFADGVSQALAYKSEGNNGAE